MLKKIENWKILKSILVRFKTIDETVDELSESKKTSISKNNSKIEVIYRAICGETLQQPGVVALILLIGQILHSQKKG